MEKEAAASNCVAALLIGDMNWRDDQTGDPLAVLGNGWTDAWQAAGSPPVLKATCGYSWRLDRCFCYSRPHASPRTAVAAKAIALLGIAGEGLVRGQVYTKRSNKAGAVVDAPLPPSETGLIA